VHPILRVPWGRSDLCGIRIGSFFFSCNRLLRRFFENVSSPAIDCSEDSLSGWFPFQSQFCTILNLESVTSNKIESNWIRLIEISYRAHSQIKLCTTFAKRVQGLHARPSCLYCNEVGSSIDHLFYCPFLQNLRSRFLAIRPLQQLGNGLQLLWLPPLHKQSNLSKWNRKGPLILLHLSRFSVTKVSVRWVFSENIPLTEIFCKIWEMQKHSFILTVYLICTHSYVCKIEKIVRSCTHNLERLEKSNLVLNRKWKFSFFSFHFYKH